MRLASLGTDDVHRTEIGILEVSRWTVLTCGTGVWNLTDPGLCATFAVHLYAIAADNRLLWRIHVWNRVTGSRCKEDWRHKYSQKEMAHRWWAIYKYYINSRNLTPQMYMHSFRFCTICNDPLSDCTSCARSCLDTGQKCKTDTSSSLQCKKSQTVEFKLHRVTAKFHNMCILHSPA